jgi:hypothetical protein
MARDYFNRLPHDIHYSIIDHYVVLEMRVCIELEACGMEVSPEFCDDNYWIEFCFHSKFPALGNLEAQTFMKLAQHSPHASGRKWRFNRKTNTVAIPRMDLRGVFTMLKRWNEVMVRNYEERKRTVVKRLNGPDWLLETVY